MMEGSKFERPFMLISIKQASTSRLTFSDLELTQDHILQVGICYDFSTVAINAVKIVF